jgi:hypothetical protein
MQRFTFQERAWPTSKLFAPKLFTLNLLSKDKFNKWMIQLGKVPTIPLKVVQQGSKSKTPKFIASIKAKELERIRKSSKIYAVDIHEILEEATSTVATMSPDATARDAEAVSSLSPEAQCIVKQFVTVFDPPDKLPPKRTEDIQILLRDGCVPPNIKGMPRINEKENLLLKKTLQRLLDREQIQPSTSEYGARLLFVKKSDGSMRMCVDYRDLNAITVKNRCPIPNMAEMRDRVKGAKVFSKIDLRDGYYNIRVAENSVSKTAFRTRFGLYEFLVMPFGLTNAPAVFSALMNRIFGDLFDVYVVSYLDDIIVFSSDVDDHHRHLAEVFGRLQNHKLFLKLSKCSLFQDKVEFCGHDLSTEGISISPNKVKAIQSRPIMSSRKDVEKYLGVMVYFQDFIKDYAKITLPLSDLLKKNKQFIWTEAAEEAVTKLIHAVTNAPVLRYFEDNRETRVFSDASQYAIAGWISQKHEDGWHPVVFTSRKLRLAELNYSNPERELLALVYTLVKQGHYLRGGIHFEVNIDCNSLESIQSMDLHNRRLARWIMLLQDFNMTVKHISGSSNKVADYLSRTVDVAPICQACKKKIKISVVLSSPTINMDEYKVASDQDSLLKEVIEWQQTKKKNQYSFYYSKFKKTNDLWRFQQRIYVPEHSSLRLHILSRYHDLGVSGHQGVRRTRARISRLYFWPGMEQDIRQFVKTCMNCQRNSERSTKLDGLLHPLPIPADRFKDVSIDFATINKTSSGFDTLMVGVDRLTKLVRLIPAKKDDSAANIAERFVKNWYSLGYGLPQSIVSDRDSKFSSKLWTAIGDQLGIDLKLSTARHQQTDGQSENAIRTYKRTAKKFASILNNDWDKNLPILEFALNNSISVSTGFTPYFLAFGFEPRVFPEEYLFQATGLPHSLLSVLHQSIISAKSALEWSQQEQTKHYNNRRKQAPSYSVGDVVLLSSDGIHWPAYSDSPSSAIPKFYGPFQVLAVDNEKENVTLMLPDSLAKTRLHPVFHVSKLKPFHDRLDAFPDFVESFSRPQAVSSNQEGEELFEIDRILNKRIRNKHPEYLVHFKGYPDSHAQWEPLTKSNRHTWESDWSLLLEFDPSVGPFNVNSNSSNVPLRRSSRLVRPMCIRSTA